MSDDTNHFKGVSATGIQLANLLRQTGIPPVEAVDGQIRRLAEECFQQGDDEPIAEALSLTVNAPPEQQKHFEELIYGLAGSRSKVSRNGAVLRYDFFVAPFIFQLVGDGIRAPSQLPRPRLAEKLAESFRAFGYMSQADDAAVILPYLFSFDELYDLTPLAVRQFVEKVAELKQAGGPLQPEKMVQLVRPTVPPGEPSRINLMHLRFLIDVFQHDENAPALSDRLNMQTPTFMNWSKAVARQLDQELKTHGRLVWPMSIIQGTAMGWRMFTTWSIEAARVTTLDRTGKRPEELCAAISRHETDDGDDEIHVVYLLPTTPPTLLTSVPWRLMPGLDDLDEVIETLLEEHRTHGVECVTVLPGVHPAHDEHGDTYIPVEQIVAQFGLGSDSHSGPPIH